MHFLVFFAFFCIGHENLEVYWWLRKNGISNVKTSNKDLSFFSETFFLGGGAYLQ